MTTLLLAEYFKKKAGLENSYIYSGASYVVTKAANLNNFAYLAPIPPPLVDDLYKKWPYLSI